MAGVMSILEFVAKTKAMEHDLKKVEHAIIARACEMVCAEAKRVLGEGYPEWPALQPETIAHKMGKGPLLETGELRGSIEWHAEGNEGQVGSNIEKAVWHELGTARIPPRPFLMGAAIRMEPLIHAMAAKAVMAVMAGRGLHSAELGELLHLLHELRHAGHALKEAADTVLDGPDDNKDRHR
jgi:phage gpG-like protein